MPAMIRPRCRVSPFGVMVVFMVTPKAPYIQDLDALPTGLGSG